jgi:hypothetical protein
MDKFFTTVGAALKTAKDKTLEGVVHLKSPPKEIACSNCPYAILIPVELFDWHCAACGSTNTWDKEKCSACAADKSSASPREPTVTCTMCHTVNPVPSNNAMKGLISAGRSTKKLAVKAADATKEAYKSQTAAPRTFACQHCSNQVDNPNWRGEGKEASEEEEQVMAVAQMTCPICKQTTSVPKMVIANSFRKFGNSLSKGSHKMFYTAAGTPFVECEICRNPCELPKKQNAPNQAISVTSNVTLTCGKCGHSFATSY